MPKKQPPYPDNKVSGGKQAKKSAAESAHGPDRAKKETPATKTAVETTAVKLEPLIIKNHKGLSARSLEINRRLNANPELAVLAFLNPVLAMRDLGVRLNKEMTHHVLSRLRHRPAMRERREELEKKLRKKLGVVPQPNNSAWVARILFQELELKTLDTRELEPLYKPLLDPEKEKRLQARRPKRTNRYSDVPRRDPRISRFRIDPPAPSARRMDLDAPLPEMKTRKKEFKRVGLEDLYFYRESHPLVRDLLELAIIQRRGIRLHSRHSIRLVREGKRGNVFHRWFRKVTFPETEP